MKRYFLFGLITIAFIFAAPAAFLFVKNKPIPPEEDVSNYADCAKQKYSIVTLESPVNTCQTRSGQKFVETPTNFNNKNSSTSTPQLAR